MTILLAIVTMLLVVCVGVIYSQHLTITHQRKLLLDALDWIEPEALVREDWTE